MSAEFAIVLTNHKPLEPGMAFHIEVLSSLPPDAVRQLGEKTP